MDVYLKNPLTGAKKKGRRGFSWTTLFFGPWPALFRGDAKWCIVQFAIDIVVGIFTAGIGSIVGHVVFGFKYNEWHLDSLRDKGYVEITQAEYFAANVPTVVPATA
jgi:hypothetical protein